MAMDAGVASRNLIGDATNKALGRPATPDYQLPSSMFNQALDALTRKPEGIGKVGEFINTALAGAKLPLPNSAGQAPAGFVRPNPLTNVSAVPAAPGLTRAQQAAAAGGQSLGMRLTPGQATGSRALQQAEAWAQSHPWTSGPFTRLGAGNQEILNRAAANSIGENSPVVDAATLGDAADRLGKVFEQVRTPEVNLEVNPQDTQDFIANLDKENEGLLPNDRNVSSHPLVKTLSGIMKRAAGTDADRETFLRDAKASLGNARIELSPDPTDTNAVSVDYLESPKPGSGALVPGVRKLLKLADEHGIVLRTDAQPMGENGIPRTALIEHYQGAGFEPQVENDGWSPLLMERQPQVTAKQMGQLSSKLGRAASKEMTSQGGDRDLGKALFAVKDHVDDILESNLSPEGKAAYSQARGQWRNLVNLTSRANVLNPSTGNVNGVALAARLAKSDRNGFLYGRNASPLYQAARFAQAFKPIVGDSGTATRSANPFNPLELALGLPANAAARFYLSSAGAKTAKKLLSAIEMAGVLGPPAARRAALSPALMAQFQGQNQ